MTAEEAMDIQLRASEAAARQCVAAAKLWAFHNTVSYVVSRLAVIVALLVILR